MKKNKRPVAKCKHCCIVIGVWDGKALRPGKPCPRCGRRTVVAR